MITIQISGLEKLLDILNQVQRPVNTTVPGALKEIGDTVESSTYQNFIQAGRPTWPSRKGTYNHPPLMDTLAMMEGALDTSQVWHHNQRRHDIDIQSTEYAVYQQEGATTWRGGEIAARPFANTVEEEEVQIENILYDAIEEFLEKK